MNILIINSRGIGGGAEKISATLHETFIEQKHSSWFVTSENNSDSLKTIKIDNFNDKENKKTILRLINRWPKSHFLRFFFRAATLDLNAFSRYLGIEDFDYPESHTILNRIPDLPDVVHLHNLHGGYFDLRFLPQLGAQFPTVLTLHDEWILTGHCAYTIDCQKWKTGCGTCPDLSRYPAIRRDATRYNYERKRRIFSRSNLFVITPSQWLMDKVEESHLNPVMKQVIPNGIDQTIFFPNEKKLARAILGIPAKNFVLLFVANDPQKNVYKDFYTINKALNILKGIHNGPLTLIALGGESEIVKGGNLTKINLPYQHDPQIVAKYYQAADIYLHSAMAENHPLTILESLSCGTPVIATAVGGIPEQINEGENGFLIPRGNAEIMALRIHDLINNQDLLLKMGKQAAVDAKIRFGMNLMVNNYLKFYKEVINSWKSRKKEIL